MRFAWHLVLTRSTNGRVDNPDRLWQIIEDYANRVVGAGNSVELRFTTQPTLSTQSFLAAVNTLALVEDARNCERDGIDGIMMAASIDPAVEQARSICKIPVVGSIEAALALTGFIGRKAGIVTISGADAEHSYAQLIEENASKYGCRDRLLAHRPVRPLSLTWKDFYAAYSRAVDGDGDELLTKFDAVTREFVKDGADVIICGNQLYGAVLDKLGYSFVTEQGAPVIDNAAAGLKMLQVLRSLQQTSGLSKSEIGPFRALPEEGVRMAAAALHSIDLR